MKLRFHSFIKNIKQIVDSFIAILYPYRCPICRKIVGDEFCFCADCWNKVYFITKPHCSVCCEPFEYEVLQENTKCINCINQKQKRYFDKLASAFVYNQYIAKAIFSFKFQHNTFLASFLARFMYANLQDFIQMVDYITPVPTHKKKLQQRGFNQSLLLAREISKHYNIPLVPDLIIKHKHTKSQVSLSGQKRKSNLKSVFSFNEKYLEMVKGKNVLIIDDVFTTGTTINECAKVLKQEAKVKMAFAATIAKTSLINKNKLIASNLYKDFPYL